MWKVIRMTAILVLFGLVQSAWADEIGHGGPASDDPNATPSDPVESQAGKEDDNWFDELVRWIFGEDEK